jgi:hypothetical protein
MNALGPEGLTMSKSERLTRIIQVYLEGGLELDTAVAELVHVYVEHGWRFSLIEAECDPRFRARMHALAVEVDAVIAARKGMRRREEPVAPIVIR